MKNDTSPKQYLSLGVPNPDYFRFPRVNPFRHGRGSDFFLSVFEYVLQARRPLRVILYVRKSCPNEAKGGKIEQEIAYACEWLKRLGCTVIEIFVEVAHSAPDSSRLAFDTAIDWAIATGADAVVALYRDRFLRNPYLKPRNPKEWPETPKVLDYVEFVKRARGVRLLTLAGPDAVSRRGRTLRGIRAQRSRGRVGGRPRASHPGWTKRRRSQLRERVRSWKQEGFSYRRIQNRLRRDSDGFPVPCVETLRTWVEANQGDN